MSRSLSFFFLSLYVLALPAAAAAESPAPILVDTQWVAEHKDDPNVVLVDMAGDEVQYQRFHIPGAVYLPYGALVQRRKDGVALRVDDPTLTKVLGLTGIERKSHVVIYDDMGGLHAGRLFWELERIGHPRVSVLDGGLVQWILEGRKAVAEPARPARTKYLRENTGGRSNDIDLAAVKKAVAAGAPLLLDVRSEAEYLGNPKSRQRSGHIPGARWWSWDQALDLKRGFRLRDDAALQSSLAARGAGKQDAPVILYCNSGHRAAQTYLTLRHLGYEQVRLYDGSIAEYARDKTAPLVLGRKPGKP